RDKEVYAGIILLAEVRNAIVHSNRRLSEARIPRLKAAGVHPSLVKEFSEKLERDLQLSDFLRFKGVVRAAANMILEEHGSIRKVVRLSARDLGFQRFSTQSRRVGLNYHHQSALGCCLFQAPRWQHPRLSLVFGNHAIYKTHIPSTVENGHA